MAPVQHNLRDYCYLVALLLLCYVCPLTIGAYLSIRLNGSLVAGRGRVELRINEVWGALSVDTKSPWTRNEARAVCGQLGYDVDADSSYDALPLGYFGPREGGVVLRLRGCQNDAVDLLHCLLQPPYQDRFNEALYIYDASVICSGVYRLAGQLKSNTGIIQEYRNEWKSLCTINWTDANSNVACRTVGFIRAESWKRMSCGSGDEAWNGAPCEGPNSERYECAGSEVSLDTCKRRLIPAQGCDQMIVFLTCTNEQPKVTDITQRLLVWIVYTLLAFLLAVALVVVYRLRKKGTCCPFKLRMQMSRANNGPEMMTVSGRVGNSPSNDSVSAPRSIRSTSTNYEPLDEVSPPPYSPISHPYIENPIVGREERYNAGRAPRCVVTDALEYFKELDVDQLIRAHGDGVDGRGETR